MTGGPGQLGKVSGGHAVLELGDAHKSSKFLLLTLPTHLLQ